jgi:hypothetical protein
MGNTDLAVVINAGGVTQASTELTRFKHIKARVTRQLNNTNEFTAQGNSKRVDACGLASIATCRRGKTFRQTCLFLVVHLQTISPLHSSKTAEYCDELRRI